MGREVEVKAKVDGDLSDKIIGAGGKFIREVFQEDVYFRHPCRDFAERDEALRLRVEDGKFMLTFKGRRVGTGAKMREEIEVGINSFEETVVLFERLGFEKAFVIRKRRKEFLLEGVLVSLDYVEGLGRFVEIEVLLGENSELEESRLKGNYVKLHKGKLSPGENSELEESRLKEKLFKISEILGIDRRRLTTESYLEMLVSKSSSSRQRT